MLYLQPRAVYPDPFRAGNHVLVLCDVMSPPAVQVTATAAVRASGTWCAWHGPQQMARGMPTC